MIFGLQVEENHAAKFVGF